MNERMNIGILGSGEVARTLGTGLIEAGHSVMLGSRSGTHEAISGWVEASGSAAVGGTFAEAAAYGYEVVLNCTAGAHSLEALDGLGPALEGKILVDVANPLDFSQGMPPRLTISGSDSLGERIQRALPGTRVVKALNTVNLKVMVEPSLIPGDHNLFICGDDPEAKARVRSLLGDWFGWPESALVDLGGISAARATEPFVILWVQLATAFETPLVSVAVRSG